MHSTKMADGGGVRLSAVSGTGTWSKGGGRVELAWCLPHR